MNASKFPRVEAKVMLVNNTDARITGEMHSMLCAFADSGIALPPVYFDCFDVKLIKVGAQTRVIINWA